MTSDPAAAQAASIPPGRSETGFFGQPRGLGNLFNVELWERFSFYGMQSIVLLYMYYEVADGGLAIDRAVAAGIVGAYGGSVYLFSVLGGWVADRLVGSERTMLASAVLIMAGHTSLALLPGALGLATGLIAIAVGSGGLKATITNLVGSLYDVRDPRRDAGFSIFYMGINIGGLLGPLLTGLVFQRFGFHLGFGLAAIGMAVGLAQYLWARRSLPDRAHHVPDPLPRELYPRYLGLAGLAVVVVLVAVLTGLLDAANLSTVVVAAIVVAAAVLFAVLLTSKRLDTDERSRVWSFIPMFVASAAFWALFQQQFTVITIYADTRLDRIVSGIPWVGTWEIPIPWVQSFNPLFIILLAPVFAALWQRLGDRQPPAAVKFGLGTVLMGAAFLVFLPMVGVAAVPVLWVALIMLVATSGELMLSPVGLSLATRLAPRAFPVLMVALFYLSVALGTALSGFLAGFYSVDAEGPYFGILGLVTIGIGVILLALSPLITRLMRGVR